MILVSWTITIAPLLTSQDLRASCLCQQTGPEPGEMHGSGAELYHFGPVWMGFGQSGGLCRIPQLVWFGMPQAG